SSATARTLLELLPQSARALVVDETGVALERAYELRVGGGELALAVERPGETQVRVRIRRPESDGALERGARRGPRALLVVRLAEVQLRLEEARRDRGRGLEVL